jgi:prevent-host-death family protein
MESVGIRQLKAHLSEYIRRAEAGETVVITDRGKEVARLAPARQTEGLRDLMAKGIVKGSGGKVDLSDIEPVKSAGEPLSEAVLEQRGPR